MSSMGSMDSMDRVWVILGCGEVRKRSRTARPYVIEMPESAAQAGTGTGTRQEGRVEKPGQVPGLRGCQCAVAVATTLNLNLNLDL